MYFLIYSVMHFAHEGNMIHRLTTMRQSFKILETMSH